MGYYVTSARVISRCMQLEFGVRQKSRSTPGDWKLTFHFSPYVAVSIVFLYLLTLLHLLYTIIHASFLEDSPHACRMITVPSSMCAVSAHIMRSAVINTVYEISHSTVFPVTARTVSLIPGFCNPVRPAKLILSHRDSQDWTIRSALGENNG